MNSYIFLDNVRFFAYHGVGQQEREVGNEFVINLKLKVDIARAAETDDVTHTVSYADVYENVKAEMEIPSKLLEHVCGRIVKRLFHDVAIFTGVEQFSHTPGKKDQADSRASFGIRDIVGKIIIYREGFSLCGRTDSAGNIHLLLRNIAPNALAGIFQRTVFRTAGQFSHGCIKIHGANSVSFRH